MEKSIPLPTVPKEKERGYPRTKVGRSEEVLLKQAAVDTRRRAHKYLEYVQTFAISDSIEDMDPSKVDIKHLEHICSALQEKKVPIPFSTRVVDRNGIPLVNMLASRRSDGLKNPPVLDISHAYDHFHSQQVLDEAKDQQIHIVHDGIIDRIMTPYHEAVQTLAFHMPPKKGKYKRRHTHILESDMESIETFTNSEGTFAVLDGYLWRREEIREDEGSQTTKYNLDSMVYQKEDESGALERCFERCGLLHTVQAWDQMGKPHHGLYPSTDITSSGKTLVGYQGYLQDTKLVSVIIAAYFEVLYPEEYKLLKPVFDAGRWLVDDKSCFLGRAFIYKLQVKLHHDKKDFPVTCTIASGSYLGGHYLYPQLMAIFRYAPGDVSFSMASKLFHAISRWTPSIMTLDDPTTPGRVCTVFFCRARAVEGLKGKPKGWGITSHFGRNGEASEREIIRKRKVGVDEQGNDIFEIVKKMRKAQGNGKKPLEEDTSDGNMHLE